MTPNLRNAYLFFREHAGYVLGRRAQGALELAKAEAMIQAQPERYRYRWVPDDVPLRDIIDITVEPENYLDEPHTIEGCVLERLVEPCEACGRGPEWEPVSSLWGIIDADPTYGRVIEAELASEEIG